MKKIFHQKQVVVQRTILLLGPEVACYTGWSKKYYTVQTMDSLVANSIFCTFTVLYPVHFSKHSIKLGIRKKPK